MWDKLTNKLRRFLNPRLYPKILRSDIRLAVTGAARAGKTVFLTSLINHLKHHSPDAFRLAAHGPRLVKIDDRSPRQRVWDTFAYEQYRACIAYQHAWPEKSRDCSQYSIAFCRDDAFFTRHKLTLYDIPGERFADAAMTYMDFDEWSQNQLKYLDVVRAQNGAGEETADCGQPREPVLAYLRLARQLPCEEISEPELLLGYKRCLAALRGRFHVHVSPSTFLLNESGKHLLESVALLRNRGGPMDEPALVEGLIRLRHSGLPEREFCPLGEAWRSANPELVRHFEARYEEYRQKVAMRVFKTLTACDGLVVLVDVANILASGPESLNDANFFIEQILKALQPGGQMLRALMSKAGLKRRIRRIAVAASQCDRFHPDDWPSLAELVRRLSERLVLDIDGVKADYFALSAVRSTAEIAGGGLRGVVQDGNGNGEDVAPEDYGVSRIPDEWLDLRGWPNHWNPASFQSLPLVRPSMPRVFQAVPEHVALARLFGFVTGWFPKALD